MSAVRNREYIEARVRELVGKGLNGPQISERLGIVRGRVHRIVADLGLSLPGAATKTSRVSPPGETAPSGRGGVVPVNSAPVSQGTGALLSGEP